MTKEQALNYSFKFPAPLMAELDEWRAKQPLKLTRSAAMRLAIVQLVKSGGLTIDGEAKQPRSGK